MRVLSCLSILVGVWVAATGSAQAMPVGPSTFCNVYPDSALCASALPACQLCHTSPPQFNDFGAAVAGELLSGIPRPLTSSQYAAGLPDALAAVEDIDSDGDGFTNIEEISVGTFPGDPSSAPQTSECPPDGLNPQYDVCNYDYDYTFRKIHLDFCGVSPSFEAYSEFAALPDDEKPGALDDALTACLDSEWWIGKDGAVWQLAHRKIRPVGGIKSGEDPGGLPLSDYYVDYQMFVYSQIDGHDARDVLTADYFVTRTTNPTTYTPVTMLGGQQMQQERRVGLMSTNWNLLYNIMFTALPRTAAAQAYRAVLGFDIAKQQGLFPVANEPVDYDDKGVTNPTCAVCHSTLDPLTYPFKNYSGFQNPGFQYSATRIEDNFAAQFPGMVGMPEAGSVLGQPVTDLLDWAQVAANSDEFAIATVTDYWKLAMGSAPEPTDTEFVDVWKAFRNDHDYSVEAMLYDLIRTEAYGVP